MTADSPRGHILTVTRCIDFDPEYPSFDWSIECRNVDKCGGWQECREPHEVDGASAEDGPYDSDEDAPWDGMDEFEFHGVLHTWRWGHGWTVPYPGCVVAANDTICDDAHDIALEYGCGKHEVDDDWDDEECRLIHVRTVQVTADSHENVEDTITWLNTLCCGAGEPPPDAKTVAEWDAPPPEPVRARVIRRIEDTLICPACIRLRFSPIHLCLRMVGICDGKGAVG